MREKERQAIIGWVVAALEACRENPVEETVFLNLCQIANFVGAPSAWNRHLDEVMPYRPEAHPAMGELERKMIRNAATEEEVAQYLAYKEESAPAMAIYSEKTVASWLSYEAEHRMREQDKRTSWLSQ